MTETCQQSILTILSDAEESLLAVVRRAATSGDYSSLDIARHAAEQVKDQAAELRSCLLHQKNALATAKGPATLATNNVKKSAYPKFAITGSTLTITGWSKKQNQEYTHKTPRENFDAVVTAISASVKQSEGQLATSDLVEYLKANRSSLPEYHTFTVLRFLREKGIVQLTTRGKYFVPRDLALKANMAWRKVEGAHA